MTKLTRMRKQANDRPEWKTEAYRDKQMHVCAKLRAPENAASDGQETHWDFIVNVTAKDGGPTAPVSASAQSDPDLTYSTQAIAENMGFLRGRELIKSE